MTGVRPEAPSETRAGSRWRIRRYGRVSSTNDLALEAVRAGEAAAWTAFVARSQTSGRGRAARTWQSPEGALLMTALLPAIAPRMGWSALAAGVAAAAALEDAGLRPGLKWPNDLQIGPAKIGGVLCETAGSNLLAVGIGMNVTNPLPEIPGGLAARAADYNRGLDVERLLLLLLPRLEWVWELLSRSDVNALRHEWHARDLTEGRVVSWDSGHGLITGAAAGIDELGALLIRTSDGRIVAASAGDVLFQPEPGPGSPDR